MDDKQPTSAPPTSISMSAGSSIVWKKSAAIHCYAHLYVIHHEC